MLTPAMIPVTAGKKTANTVEKGRPSGFCQAMLSGGAGERPPKNATSEAAIAAITRNWVRIARSAPLSEIRVSATHTAVPVRRGSRPRSSSSRVSANPTT